MDRGGGGGGRGMNYSPSRQQHPQGNLQLQGRQQNQPQRQNQRYDSQQMQHNKRPREDEKFDRSRDKRNTNRDRQRSQEYNQGQPPYRDDRGGGGGDRGIGVGSGGTAGISREIEIEMKNLLTQMYSNMDVKDTMTLEQLATANADLYTQMKITAENHINEYNRNQRESGKIANKIPGEKKRSMYSAAGLGVGVISTPITGSGVEGMGESSGSSVNRIEYGPYVNAFVAEASVVLDISRAKALVRCLLETDMKYSTDKDKVKVEGIESSDIVLKGKIYMFFVIVVYLF